MNIDFEKGVLFKRYYECLEKVNTNNYCKLFADEKIHHSMQVLGAAKYIFRHEEIFQNYNHDLSRQAILACLFHDIGRFKEIENIYTQGLGGHNDHSLLGYEILKSMPEYNMPLITIPVKHHGHLIEELYKDEEFLSHDKDTQQKIKEIAFLVRDADKIANFYLMKRSRLIYRSLFLSNYSKEQKKAPFSPSTLKQFYNKQPTDRRLVYSSMDGMLNYLSWIFDINYQSSFDFLLGTDCIEYQVKLIDKYNKDKNRDIQKRIEKTVDEFLIDKQPKNRLK